MVSEGYILEILVSLFISYVCLSIYYFKNPQKLWHKHHLKNNILKRVQKANPDKLLHISHRGGCKSERENTLEAFHHSYNVGTNMFEMDVCLTKDKKIVVFHDTDLNRLCGVNKKSIEANYDEFVLLPEFSIDFHVPPFKASDGKRYQANLLEDVFKAFPNTLINVEIKTVCKEAIELVDVLVAKYNRYHLTMWGVMKLEDQWKMEKKNQDTVEFFSFQESMKIIFLYLSGLLPFWKIYGDAYQIPLYTQSYKTWQVKLWWIEWERKFSDKGKKPSILDRILAAITIKIQTILLFGYVRLNDYFLKSVTWHLSKRGHFVFVWVINEEEDFQKALDYKVHGIITDVPLNLKNFLIKKGKYLEPKHLQKIQIEEEQKKKQ